MPPSQRQLGSTFSFPPLRRAEVAEGWARIDERVDMFALGVVAFELWHPFATGMERAALLRELQGRGALPPAWEAAHSQVGPV